MVRDVGEVVREHDAQRAWIAHILSQLQGQDWFGKLTITMERGVIKRIVREEVELPPIEGMLKSRKD